jgi:hypothetical protein
MTNPMLVKYLERVLERAKAGEIHLFVGVAAMTISEAELALAHAEWERVNALAIVQGKEPDPVPPPRARVEAHACPGGIIEHLDPISRSALWRTFCAGLVDGTGKLDAQLTLMNAKSDGGPLSS